MKIDEPKLNKFMSIWSSKQADLMEVRRRLTEAECQVQKVRDDLANKSNELYYFTRESVCKLLEESTTDQELDANNREI